MRTHHCVLAGALLVALASSAADRAAAQGSAAYQTACTDAGVPLPPGFGATGTGGTPLWRTKSKADPTKQLIQDNSLVFDGGNEANDVTEVWIYERPAAQGGGTCMALPRRKKVKSPPLTTLDNEVYLLGVICQSDNTKKPVSACFFDNVDRTQNYGPTGKDEPRINGTDVTMIDITKFRGGDQLHENCTTCHRGDNVYLIIPDSATADAKDKTKIPKSVMYTPISGKTPRPYWVNPPIRPGFTVTLPGGPPKHYKLAGPGKGCQECHAIPEPTVTYKRDMTGKLVVDNSAYCGMLLKVIDGTYPDGSFLMPPKKTVLTDEQKDDIAALRAYCKALGYPP